MQLCATIQVCRVSLLGIGAYLGIRQRISIMEMASVVPFALLKWNVTVRNVQRRDTKFKNTISCQDN